MASLNETLETELRSQAAKPPLNDRYIEAFSQAALNLLLKSELPQLASQLNWLSTRSPSYAINIFLRALQKQLLYINPDYPTGFDRKDAWIDAIRMLSENIATGSELMNDITHNDVQSNIAERYKSLKIILQLLSHRYARAINILDVGCSRNHGLKKLYLNLPFKPVKCGIAGHGTFSDAVLNTCFNNFISSSVTLGVAIGSDIVDIHDTISKRWAKSCSFYPSELLDSKLVAEYDYLDEQDIPGVGFVQGDFRAEGLGDTYIESKFDIIVASTFLYQLNDEQRSHAQTMLRNYLSPNGAIIYQDFVQTDKYDATLEFELSWFDLVFPYRTILEFAEDPLHRMYEVLRWDSGRCNRWVPGRDLSNVLELTPALYTHV